MNRSSLIHSLAFVTLASLALTGCAPATPSVDSGLPPLAPMEVIEDVLQGPPQLSELEIKQQMLGALSLECPDLSDFALDPARWEFLEPGDATAPYELSLESDQGWVVVTFQPDPLPAVWLTPEYLEYSNDSMYYAGCSGIATEPNGEVLAPVEEETRYYADIPNLLGYTESEARSWGALNSNWVNFVSRSGGLNASADCLVNGWGTVTSQTPAPGRVELMGTRIQVTVAINCG